MTVPSQDFYVMLPNVAATEPNKLVIYHHGMTETCSGPITENIAEKRALFLALTGAGYIVAASNAHGNNWGNDASQADYLELYTYLRTCYNITKVMFIGQSMGGLSALLMFASGAIPVTGFAGIYPVCNLADVYSNAGFTGSINAAYGISGDYAAKTAGHDPVLIAGTSFAGKRMRFYASPNDVTVPAATNSTAMAAIVADYATESDVVECTGVHGDASHFQSEDLLTFFGRC